MICLFFGFFFASLRTAGQVPRLNQTSVSILLQSTGGHRTGTRSKAGTVTNWVTKRTAPGTARKTGQKDLSSSVTHLMKSRFVL